MWKLVKTELDYLKFPIIGTWILFIGLSIASRWFLRFDAHYSPLPEFFTNITGSIVLIQQVLNITLMYFEIRESRVMAQTILPLSRIEVEFARLITPGLILVQALLLIIVCDSLLSLLFPTKVGLYMLSFDESPLIVIALLILTYSTRLFSEWQGRVLLFTLWGTAMFIQLIVPLFAARFVSELNHAITESWINSPTFPAIVIPVVIVILFASFMTRRSYIS